MGLTVAKIRSLTRPGRYGDGSTLYLTIEPGGSKHWTQRIVIHGRRRDLGLGAWPVVPLAKARARAFANRVTISDGGDPRAEGRRVPTFAVAAGKAYETLRPGWTSAKSAEAWRSQIERLAVPKLGRMPVDKITRADVLAVLSPVARESAQVSRKLHARIRSVLTWCQASGHVEHNAADAAISAALPAAPAKKNHHKALAYSEVGRAFAAIQAADTASETVRALVSFLILTAARSGEVRGMKWNEVDVDAATWRIPAERMKAGREHRVPLSHAALAILEQARKFDDGSGLVFPSPTKPGRPLWDMPLQRVIRAAGVDCVPHGFRSSFRDWAAEQTTTPHAVCEMALAHAVGSAVERSYARSDLFTKRAELMRQWAAHVLAS